MLSAHRFVPYTKQLVLMALYDVLDQEKSEYRRSADGDIRAGVSVYGNFSEFSISVTEELPATNISIAVMTPGEGLSEMGQQRAANYLADRVEQLLENELTINCLMHRKIKEA